MNKKMTMRLTWQKRVKRFLFSMLVSRLFLRGSRSRVTRLSAEFVFRIKANYPTANLFHSREKLWRSFDHHLGNNEWVGFEFGVASGDSTRIFLRMPYFKNCAGWNGFDTFFGLPKEWGDLPKGAFSTNGIPPQIKNELIQWHVGRIESTCKEISKLKNLDKNFLILFDFDLYSATKAAWDVIANYLKPGDIIYFDEAYEADENQMIEEILAKGDFSLEVIGYTTMGIAFRVGN
jgi:hypothetical protein